MAVVWETVDQLGRTVILTEEGWAHVLDRHADMSSALQAIRDAIENADEIARDRLYPRREIHYQRLGVGPQYLRVVVNYGPSELHGWAGRVITAHITTRRNKSEVLLWPSKSSKS